MSKFPLAKWINMCYYSIRQECCGSMVKRLRHRPFTAVTRVRFPLESSSYEIPNPLESLYFQCIGMFLLLLFRFRSNAITKRQDSQINSGSFLFAKIQKSSLFSPWRACQQPGQLENTFILCSFCVHHVTVNGKAVNSNVNSNSGSDVL